MIYPLIYESMHLSFEKDAVVITTTRKMFVLYYSHITLCSKLLRTDNLETAAVQDPNLFQKWQTKQILNSKWRVM